MLLPEYSFLHHGLALGASVWDILRQLWTEGLVIGVSAPDRGLVLALLMILLVKGFLPSFMMPVGGVSIDAWVQTNRRYLTGPKTIAFSTLLGTANRKSLSQTVDHVKERRNNHWILSPVFCKNFSD
jgi:hypothetical protein